MAEETACREELSVEEIQPKTYNFILSCLGAKALKFKPIMVPSGIHAAPLACGCVNLCLMRRRKLRFSGYRRFVECNPAAAIARIKRGHTLAALGGLKEGLPVLVSLEKLITCRAPPKYDKQLNSHL
jgi:hypothetical protein